MQLEPIVTCPECAYQATVIMDFYRQLAHDLSLAPLPMG